MSGDERNSAKEQEPAASSRVTPNGDGSLPAAAEGRAIRWDAMAAIIASMIGFLALLVAGYTAYTETRTANIIGKQTRAQVWPYLEVGVAPGLPAKIVQRSGLSPEQARGMTFMVANRGVGPAIIRGVEVDVNGKPQPDWDHVLKSLGLQAELKSKQVATLNGRVLAAGQSISFLMIPGEEEWARIRPKLSELTMRLCYCSTLGDCWEYSIFANAKGTQQVKACHKIPQANQFIQ